MPHPLEPEQTSDRIHIKLRINLNLGSRAEFIKKHSAYFGRTGIYIKTKETAPKGSRIEFEYLLNNERRVFHGVGIVRRCNEGHTKDIPPGIAVELIDIDALSEALLSESLEKFGEGKLAPKRARTTDEVLQAKKKELSPKTAPQILNAEDSDLDDLLGVLDAPATTPKAGALDDFDIDLDLDTAENAEQEEESEPVENNSKKTKTGSFEINTDELEEKDADETATQTDKKILIIDLAGASPLALLYENANAPADVRKATLYPEKVEVKNDTFNFGEQGIWLPNFMSWYSTKRPAPYAELVLKRLHISFDEKETDALKISSGEKALASNLFLNAWLKHIVSKHDVESASARVILPSNAKPQAEKDVHDGLEQLGFSVIKIFREHQATHRAPKKNITDSSLWLKMTMTLFETRIALMRSHEEIIGQRWNIDDSLWEADRNILEHLSLELLRQHHIDIGNDPVAMQELLGQVTQLRRTKHPNETWEFTIQDKTIHVGLETLIAWCQPITDRLLSTCAQLLDEHDIGIKTLELLDWNLEETSWPGLAPALSQRLQLHSILPNTGIWSRIADISDNLEQKKS